MPAATLRTVFPKPITAASERPNKERMTDARTVGQTAWQRLQAHHKGWSVDELLIHPADAIALCRHVNDRMSTDRPHSDILRALINARKHGGARGTARRSRK